MEHFIRPTHFISYRNWVKLFEQQKKEEPIFGCVMLEATINDWVVIHLAGIEEKDLYNDKTNEYGLEETPHMTLIYGIHEDEIDPPIIRETIKENVESFMVKINKIGYFETDEYDVVKYDITPTKQMLKYRKLFLKTFENTQTYKEFHPHMTLAYVKKGKAKKYAKTLDEPFEVTFTRGVYSYHSEVNGEIENKRSVIRLKRETDGDDPDLTHA
jgi:2'-5' RNA ligase